MKLIFQLYDEGLGGRGKGEGGGGGGEGGEGKGGERGCLLCCMVRVTIK